MDSKQVWFVTGASKGLGLSLVRRLLNEGYAVAATSRSVDDLNKAVGAGHKNFLALGMDLKSEESISSAIEQTVKHFGKVDVVVNNAGYGQLGSLEELTDREVRGNFEVNVFGLLSVIRKSMPHLRKQRSGHIFNISSVAGITGAFAGWGIYCGTKFAVSGLTEALAAEAKSLGIHVTTVEPGYFRTEFLSSDSLSVPANPIDAYKEVRESQKLHQLTINGNQPGDPEKAVAAIIQVANAPNPPVHLLLGQDAYDMTQQKIKALQDELEKWKSVTVSTGF